MQRVNNSGIAMSVAAEVVSADALTLHFLQATEAETERGPAADHITHSRGWGEGTVGGGDTRRGRGKSAPCAHRE